MKKQILTVAAALVFTALAPAQSHAQQSLQVNIPFAFQAGSTSMSAGEYRVRRSFAGNESAQQIQRTDSSASVIVLTNNVDSRVNDYNEKLIFHCYGRECFLYEIWYGNGHGSITVGSRREKELSQTRTENELAVVSLPLAVRP
jgi:curli biogenesis system outer membrane secretion channel CsgG